MGFATIEIDKLEFNCSSYFHFFAINRPLYILSPFLLIVGKIIKINKEAINCQQSIPISKERGFIAVFW
jgi:hypothetical protein